MTLAVLSRCCQRSATSRPFAERELSSELPSPKSSSQNSAPSLVVIVLMPCVRFGSCVAEPPDRDLRSVLAVRRCSMPDGLVLVPGRRQGRRRPWTGANAYVPAAIYGPAKQQRHRDDRPRERRERRQRDERDDHERDQREPRERQEDDRRNDDERRPCIEVPHHDLSSRIGVSASVRRPASRAAAIAAATRARRAPWARATMSVVSSGPSTRWSLVYDVP